MVGISLYPKKPTYFYFSEKKLLGGQWKQVPAQGGRGALSLPAHLTFPPTLI